MSSIFSRIIDGEIPCYKILENDDFLAFLDIMPLVHGHVLVVPKKEIDEFFSLDDNLLSQIMVFSKPIAIAIKKAFPCKRVGVAVIGLEVPHAHVHLLPLNDVGNINFQMPKLQPSVEELKDAQAKICAFLKA
ncbi:MAG: HIT family protein [Bacteroidota bacterium]|jgi:histidine triad (HIT) family protein